MPLERARRRGGGGWGRAHTAAGRRGLEILEAASASDGGSDGGDGGDGDGGGGGGGGGGPVTPLVEASATYAQGCGQWIEDLLRAPELPASLLLVPHALPCICQSLRLREHHRGPSLTSCTVPPPQALHIRRGRDMTLRPCDLKR